MFLDEEISKETEKIVISHVPKSEVHDSIVTPEKQKSSPSKVTVSAS
jgi:hypothetical protein